MQKLNYNQTYIVFDTETEGLNLHSSKPWQLGWLKCKGNKVIERHDRWIDFKGLKVNKLIRRLTGFTDQDYSSKKEPLLNVLSDFEKELYDPNNMVIGQNLLGFDVYMVAEMQRMAGKKVDYSYLPRIYDTRALGKAVRESIDKPSDGFLSWQYKMMNDRTLKSRVSQKELLKYFGIEFEEEKLHNAMYDIEKCFEVFLACKKQLDL